MSYGGKAYPPPPQPPGSSYYSVNQLPAKKSSNRGQSSSGAGPSYAVSYSSGGSGSAGAASTTGYEQYGYYSDYYDYTADYTGGQGYSSGAQADYSTGSYAGADNSYYSNQSGGYQTQTGGYAQDGGYSQGGTRGRGRGGAGRGAAQSGERGRGSYGGGGDRGRGRGNFHGDQRGGFRGRGRGSQNPVIKARAAALSNEQKQKIENNNMKQLVAPKPPNKILNEMMGGPMKYEYCENPPLPPGVQETEKMHTLKVTIDGDVSSGTGPSHEIAKNIAAEHAIMGVVARRYGAINDMVAKGMKSKEELLLEDETPFELASIAIFKMLNEWEANGFHLPQDLEDVLYTSHRFVPVKERMGWIRGSNLGYTTALQDDQGGQEHPGHWPGARKRPMRMPDQKALENKNPIAFLNEVRGTVEYVDLGQWGVHPNITYTVGANIEGIPYSGTSDNKKEAKKQCAIDILTRLYRITIPNTPKHMPQQSY